MSNKSVRAKISIALEFFSKALLWLSLSGSQGVTLFCCLKFFFMDFDSEDHQYEKLFYWAPVSIEAFEIISINKMVAKIPYFSK